MNVFGDVHGSVTAYYVQVIKKLSDAHPLQRPPRRRRTPVERKLDNFLVIFSSFKGALYHDY